MKSAILMSSLGVLLLSACATPAPEASQPAGTAATSTLKNSSTLTGSRLARASSDRTLKGINNQTFQQDWEIRSIHNEVGARSE